MKAERWQQVKGLLEEILEASEDRRESLLAERCAGDPDLRMEVEALLAADERAGAVLEPDASAEARPTPVTAGDRLGPYEILGLVGAGGMGEVYRARDTRLGREVAIKTLPASLSGDPERLRRFEQEARAEGVLNHPNVLTVHDVGTEKGTPYFVTELLEGESLRDRLQRGPLPVREAVGVALQIARGLAAAHEKGIVHRDLKPENVFLTRGGPAKILDFGVAKLLGPSSLPEDVSLEALSEAETAVRVQTGYGALVGTLAYMSPEQARGAPVDFRSDIFSLGIVLYEMVSGTDPFRRPTAAGTREAILDDLPPPAQPAKGRAPAELQRILRTALAKDPSQRYASTGRLLDDLLRLERRLEGWRLSPALVTAVGTLVGAVVALSIWLGRPPPTPAREKAPVSVLIADVDNRTGETVFDGALEQALQLGLEGAPFVTAFDRTQARRQVATLGRGEVSRLDEEAARLVSTSLGIRFVVAGAIGRSGTRYELETHLVDPLSGEILARARARADSRADVLRAVDGLAVRLRSELGDVDPESALGGETFTTASLSAMGSYARAQELHHQGHNEEAIREYRAAIAQDPDFGRAYCGLAAVLYNQGERGKSEEQFKKALAHLDRMTERERYRTRGLYYILVRDYRKAIQEYERLIERFPADSAGHGNLAFSYFLARDMERALAEGRRTVDIYPKLVPARSNLALYAMYAGDFESTEKEARQVLEESPSYVKAHVALALSQLARGETEEARATYGRLEGVSARGASFAAMGLADVDLYEGRLAAATRALEKGIAGDLANESGTAAAVKSVALARVRLLRGHRPEALSAVETALGRTHRPNVAYPAALVLIASGRASAANGLAAELASSLESDPRAYAKLIKGEIALDRGNPREAIERFQEANALADTWIGHLALARAYLDAGAPAAAHSELELCLRRRGEATAVFLDDVPTYRLFPPVLFHMARAEDELGINAAHDTFRSFLATKRNSDWDDPLVLQARNRLSTR